MEGACSVIEAMLGVQVHAYSHARAAEPIFRTVEEVVLPAAVSGSVDCVIGLSTFPNLFRGRPSVAAPQVTPATIKKLYNITDTASGVSKV